jgi:diaminobutyrate-2-oxoglutarate transaminase
MSVATSLIEESSGRITTTPAETLYQFNESPLLARQSQQESNARSYPRRIPLALKRAKGLYVEDVEGRRSSTAWPAPAPWRWGITTRW